MFLAVISYLIYTMPSMTLFCAVVFPTVVHVSFFTLVFLLTGALRSKSKAGLVSVATWVFAVAVIFLFYPEASVLHGQWAVMPRYSWEMVADGVGRVLHAPSAAIYPFLTFSYTYHFLNWFSKTELLKWHKVTGKRLYLIPAVYLVAVVTCFRDYPLGSLVFLTPLSYLHVVLEYPLDIQVLSALPAAVSSALRKKSA